MLFGVKKSSTPSPALNNDRSLSKITSVRRCPFAVVNFPVHGCEMNQCHDKTRLYSRRERIICFCNSIDVILRAILTTFRYEQETI